MLRLRMIELPQDKKKELETTLFFKRDEGGQVKAVTGSNLPVATTSPVKKHPVPNAGTASGTPKGLPLDF